MKALVIAAHGSRRKETGEEVALVAAKLAQKTGKDFDFVKHAFLQFCEPFLDDVIDRLVQKGVKQVIIFPFFIAAGSHILKDIPQLIQAAKETHPGLDMKMTCHLGALDSVEQVILKEVARFTGSDSSHSSETQS